MGIEVTCPRGHVVDLDDAAADDEVRCPECNLVVPVPSSDQPSGGNRGDADAESASAEPSKSLWQVMQQTEAEDSEPAGETESPDVGQAEAEQAEKTEAAPKGLWNVMSDGSTASGQDDTAATDDDSASSVTIEPEGEPSTTDQQDSPDETTSESPKGLWNVMDAQSSELDTADAAESATEDSTEVATADGEDSPKGLWNLMGAPQAAEAPSAAEDNSNQSADHSIQVEFYSVDGTQEHEQFDESAEPATATQGGDFASESPEFESVAKEQWDDSEYSEEHEVVVETAEPEIPWTAPPTTPRPRVVVKTGLTANSWISLLLGVLAVPLSGMAMLQAFWAKLPATIAGLAALVLGLQAIGEIRRSRGKRTGMPFALLGMLLGVVGMFLGPTVVAEYGQQVRQSLQREQTMTNLTAIGKALQSYHGQHNQFPAGGIFADDPDGSEVPMHGWMTALLPYLGEEQLHRSIDFKQPYDAEVNGPAMKHVVPNFLAAGIEKRKNARGFAVTHFAGVGGEFVDDRSGLVPIGIFGHNSKVTQKDVSDGLSQTIVVGEISQDFPPWGSPENWRAIGDGLNKDINGFGNSNTSGALFLKADGSVRFYSNKTQRRILQELSTRNAGDFVPEDLR